MNTERDLNYRLYIQREENFSRTSYSQEFERYNDVSSGDINKVKQNFTAVKKNFYEGKGTLSDDPVTNVRYHVIIATALVSRACINGGMNHDVAYTLSDIYIRRADKCNNADELIDILGEMQIDFAERMRKLKKQNIISIHIRKCIDYIYDHLHEKLTVKSVAEYLNINESYLSKLFVKETGRGFREFIIDAKISASKNMLIYSEFSQLDISLSLGFSSQSAFINVFRKATGQTPAKFREMYKY